MGSAYEIAQEDASGTILSKLAGPEADDVDGTDLVYLPGNILKIDLSALAAENDIVAVQNPYGVDVIIKNAVIRVVTAGGTATAVLDVDVVDGPTDTGDDIFDGIDANATPLTNSDEVAAGTNAEHTSWLWEKAGATLDHVTTKLLVAAAANLVAFLYLECVPTE